MSYPRRRAEQIPSTPLGWHVQSGGWSIAFRILQHCVNATETSAGSLSPGIVTVPQIVDAPLDR